MKIGLLVISLLCITACSGESTIYRKSIQNDTGRTITLYFLGENNSVLYEDTVVVGANITEEIYFLKDEKSSVSVVQPCAVYADDTDTVLVEVTGGGNLIKSLHNNDDWMVEKIGGEQTCTFVITDADIQ